MPYPNSPFRDDFNTEILIKLVGEAAQISETPDLAGLLKWLCTFPKISSYRVNTLKYSTNAVLELIKNKLSEVSSRLALKPPQVYIHESFNDLIIVHSFDVGQLDLAPKKNEVVVDVHCAAAVLRGACIFAPGIVGMTSGTRTNEDVSIYVDVAKQCKKGFQKIYDPSKKIFIGNGVAKMIRNELFGENLQPSGVAIETTCVISGCPPLGDDFLPSGSALLQNIPSIICVHALDPKPGERILDMCASPGNKTTHIAALMDNRGLLVAIDKTPIKVKKLCDTCAKYGAKVVALHADSTKIFDANSDTLNEKPPFGAESFDKILLDAPCSALGKRPQFINMDSEKVVRSFVPLQRKLFQNAVSLLKVGGSLVYSTCTITAAENEGLVAWALNSFHCLELENIGSSFGSAGWNLSNTELSSCVRRFGHQGGVDSVGFFIAKFIKRKL